MRVHSITVVVCALTALGGQVLHGPAASAGSQGDRAADLAAIEKMRQQDIAATFSRDPVALTDYWTDDAIRLGVGAPPEIGKETIRRSNERQTANQNFKVLSYVPETRDFTFLDGGWAVEWRTYSGSYADSPGGEAKHVRGTVLMVLKKLPNGSWKCFRAMGSMEPGTPGKIGDANRAADAPRLRCPEARREPSLAPFIAFLPRDFGCGGGQPPVLAAMEWGRVTLRPFTCASLYGTGVWVVTRSPDSASNTRTCPSRVGRYT